MKVISKDRDRDRCWVAGTPQIKHRSATQSLDKNMSMHNLNKRSIDNNSREIGRDSRYSRDGNNLRDIRDRLN